MSYIVKNNKKYSDLSAKDIKFDNSGTTLESTNVQDSISELNKNLGWKIYSSIPSLGLTSSNITMDDILDSLLQRGKYTMLIVPLFKSDFPNLTFGGTGLRHMFTIKCVSGYVTIEDFDISNMTIHINAHNGNGYIGWKTL